MDVYLDSYQRFGIVSKKTWLSSFCLKIDVASRCTSRRVIVLMAYMVTMECQLEAVIMRYDNNDAQKIMTFRRD